MATLFWHPNARARMDMLQAACSFRSAREPIALEEQPADDTAETRELAAVA